MLVAYGICHYEVEHIIYDYLKRYFREGLVRELRLACLHSCSEAGLEMLSASELNR